MHIDVVPVVIVIRCVRTSVPYVDFTDLFIFIKKMNKF